MTRFLLIILPVRITMSIIVVLGLCVFSAKAQNDGNVSLYWAVPTLYNPSMAGCDSAMKVTIHDRMQWVGVKNAPQTMYISLDTPFEFLHKRHGAGVSLLTDKAGLFATNIISAQYSYSKQLWGGRLAAGLSLGMVNQSFKGGEIYIPDGDAWEPSDEYLPRNDVSSQAMDMSLGVFYQKMIAEKYDTYAGFSAQHLNQASIDLDEYAYFEEKRTYYFLAGCNIPLTRTLFILQPSVLVKTTAQATQVDLTFRATYNNRFWGGIGYRHGDAVVVMIGANIQSFRFGYSYDVGTSALAKASSGSHELMMSYLIKMNLGKNKKHPHKSIRIL